MLRRAMALGGLTCGLFALNGCQQVVATLNVAAGTTGGVLSLTGGAFGVIKISDALHAQASYQVSSDGGICAKGGPQRDIANGKAIGILTNNAGGCSAHLTIVGSDSVTNTTVSTTQVAVNVIQPPPPASAETFDSGASAPATSSPDTPAPNTPATRNYGNEPRQPR